MMKVGSKISLAAVFLIFSIFFLVGLITFKNYGIWTDEEFQRSSGFYWLNYVLSFTPFENLKTSANEISAQIGGFSLPSVKGNEPYGIIFDLPAAFIETIFEIDIGGISGKKSLDKILSLEQNKNLINIGVASWLPLQRSIELLDKAERKRIQVVGQEYDKADYIYTNFISEVDKNINDKYEIPSNFIKIDEYIVDGIKVYEIYKKK